MSDYQPTDCQPYRVEWRLDLTSLRGEWFAKGYQSEIVRRMRFIAAQQIAARDAGQAPHDGESGFDFDRRIFVRALFASPEDKAQAA